MDDIPLKDFKAVDMAEDSENEEGRNLTSSAITSDDTQPTEQTECPDSNPRVEKASRNHQMDNLDEILELDDSNNDSSSPPNLRDISNSNDRIDQSSLSRFLQTPHATPRRKKKHCRSLPSCWKYFSLHNCLTKRCSCVEGNSLRGSWSSASSYERLGMALQNITQPDESEELHFYIDDCSAVNIMVEKNLRACDLCELLRVKTDERDISLFIVESWPMVGIERTLEDHEDVLAVHREMRALAPKGYKRFYFRRDFLQYEFFVCPKFFPKEMLLPDDEDRSRLVCMDTIVRNNLMSQDKFVIPRVHGTVWLRDDTTQKWKKTYMILCNRKLHLEKKTYSSLTAWTRRSQQCKISPKRSLSPKAGSSQTPSSKYQHEESPTGAVPKRPAETDLIPIARLSDYHIYRITNSNKCYNAPYPWGICLTPTTKAEAEDSAIGGPRTKFIAVSTEKERNCWLTVMRLAKYGKQIRENYKAFKNKQCEQAASSKDQYQNYKDSRSRVAMDFTGSVGRIVEDPKEARDIAEHEGLMWRRAWKPFTRLSATLDPGKRSHGLDGGIHVLQPWYHGNIKRDVAAAIIRDHGSVDGVFLVRESRSNPGAFVLTYKYNDKIIHTPIFPTFDERKYCWLYSLDKGTTKFYDLLQLVEFYQLNNGSLPTRLTHYIQSDVKTPMLKPEDGGASPSPLDANRRLPVKPRSGNPMGI
ncbi:growth factor receptor-bound protein 14-like isoform X2 [Prorops nasuta]|uniref:growth factor receptor-bound protein 14-like isoform X2 n=1 Tax=Prorops nasuta TaxID=863751 RepID=UPI0034CE0CB7